MSSELGRPRTYNDMRVSQIRMESSTFEKVRAIATHEGRSMNAQLVFWARAGIAQFEQEHGPIETSYED